MGYLHIDNLYKNTEIIDLFLECYALEKIHGTSAHIKWNLVDPGANLVFFPGGEKYERFKALFDEEKLTEHFQKMGCAEVTIFGEAYGGRQQGMKEVYGPDLKFVAFDVKVGNLWLSVPKAEKVVKEFGLEFVYYDRGPATEEWVNSQRDLLSKQAERNGMGEKKGEGIVIRPVVELRKNNGSRLIVKHKRDDFRETRAPRKNIGAAKQKILNDAREIAEEWVVPMRLTHVLDKLPEATDMTHTKSVINAMVEDVKRESEGEVVWSDEVRTAIGRAAAKLFKARVSKLKVKQ
jgi:hypothetical protein